MNRRGFIFTTDALLALLLSAFLLYITYSTLDRVTKAESYSGEMRTLSRDTLAAMEESGLLARAVQQSRNDEIRGVLDALPPNTCADAAVYSTSIVVAAQRTGCNCTNASTVVAAQRTFVAIMGSTQVEGRAVMHACQFGSQAFG